MKLHRSLLLPFSDYRNYQQCASRIYCPAVCFGNTFCIHQSRSGHIALVWEGFCMKVEHCSLFLFASEEIHLRIWSDCHFFFAHIHSRGKHIPIKISYQESKKINRQFIFFFPSHFFFFFHENHRLHNDTNNEEQSKQQNKKGIKIKEHKLSWLELCMASVMIRIAKITRKTGKNRFCAHACSHFRSFTKRRHGE